MASAKVEFASLPQLVDLRSLKPYEANSRTHTPEQIEQVKQSFRQFGFVGVVAHIGDGIRIGHARQIAALEMWQDGETVMGPGKREPLPEWHAPAVDITGLSDDEIRALVIADNQLALNAGWDEDILRAEIEALAAVDFDLPVLGLDKAELDRLLGLANGSGQGGQAGGLADEFLIPPFSVLNAREGWWQDRKRRWIALGIESEVGRGENLLRFSETLQEPDPAKRAAAKARHEAVPVVKGAGWGDGGPARRDPAFYAKKRKIEAELGHEITTTEFRENHWDGYVDAEPGQEGKGLSYGTQGWVQDTIGGAGLSANQSGTSIFDPTLCELIYRWFAPKGGRVLDPFAGGSVRGIVAAALGRAYVGIDLRPEQVDANRAQWPGVAAQLDSQGIEGQAGGLIEPRWHQGDSMALLGKGEDEIGDGFDLVFRCPPYGDLEVYSDDPADISTLPMAEFDSAYEAIIRRALARLADDRFACFVVGDYRDRHGLYANFVSKTIEAFGRNGAALYNEIILLTAIGSLPIRMAKQFRSTRKVGKTHQNVLVFVKGDPRKATEHLGPVDVSAALADIEPEDQDEAPPAERAEPTEPAPPPADEQEREIEETPFGERIVSLGGEV